ncbi:MAG TPA: hypothetical protein VIL86_07980 [Tepidisphaeraceae bacterium]
MPRAISLLSIALAGTFLTIGCTPPPQRVPVPASRNPEAYYDDREPSKPLIVQRNPNDGRPFDDPALVSQAPPEERAFVEAYNHVGRPRIVLFVNRTLEGQLVPVNPDEPVVSVEHSKQSTAGVNVETRDTVRSEGRYRDDVAERSDRYESKGPGEYHEKTEVYLKPGQYDEVAAKSLDYQAMENLMTDWLAAGGNVEIISPIVSSKPLTEQQMKDLQAGRQRVMAEIARQLDADILVQVQAHPTRQTQQGLEVRVIAEAISLRGGQSIGRAVVDVPPPLDKVQMNKFTRFLSRKLMDDMTNTWRSGDFRAPPDRKTPPSPEKTAPEPRGQAPVPPNSDVRVDAGMPQPPVAPAERPIAPVLPPTPPEKAPSPPVAPPPQAPLPKPPEAPLPKPPEASLPPSTQEKPLPQPEKPQPPSTQEDPSTRPGSGKGID